MDIKKRSFRISFAFSAGAIVLFVGTWWVYYLQVAHSSFENYYRFRGCTRLLERTDSYGICRLSSGGTIKLVKFEDRWYLDGDLPWR